MRPAKPRATIDAMPRARRLAALVLVGAPLVAWSEDAPLLPPVRVDRVLVDARILDPRGRELRGLGPGDLRVAIDGRPGHLESVEWISEAAPRGEPAIATSGRAEGAASSPTEAGGRLVVFLFQKDFFEPGRLKGLIHMKEYAAELARHLTPLDRAAVLTFDSHLRLHLDFTGDRALLEETLRHALLQGEPSELALGSGPSLRALLDGDAARRAATPEKGLEVLGQALEKLPGAKSLVFFCWGLGSLQGGIFQMNPDYDPARAALERSRTAVFALDVSTADSHSLEVGLQQVATDTGGFYARTYDSPVVAMDRLRGALSGHYVLALERPAGSRGSHRVAVDLVARKGTVLARSTYVD
jgi:VWFA-related protein